jgi:toxin-antitoxin system, antitoxin component, xre family
VFVGEGADGEVCRKIYESLVFNLSTKTVDKEAPDAHNAPNTFNESVALEKFMSITAFGKAIRDARQATGETLLSMAEAMQCSVAFLSAIETGKSKIPAERVRGIEQFFAERGYQFSEDLADLAVAANGVLPLDRLDMQQRLLVTGFAKSQWDSEQLKLFADFLAEMRGELKQKEDK